MSPPSTLRAPGTDEGISTGRVDIAIARIASGFGSLFFLLSLMPLTHQAENLRPGWTVTAVAILAFGLVLPVVGSFQRWRSSRSALAFTAAYPLAVISWPFPP